MFENDDFGAATGGAVGADVAGVGAAGGAGAGVGVGAGGVVVCRVDGAGTESPFIPLTAFNSSSIVAVVARREARMSDISISVRTLST